MCKQQRQRMSSSKDAVSQRKRLIDGCKSQDTCNKCTARGMKLKKHSKSGRKETYKAEGCVRHVISSPVSKLAANGASHQGSSLQLPSPDGSDRSIQDYTFRILSAEELEKQSGLTGKAALLFEDASRRQEEQRRRYRRLIDEVGEFGMGCVNDSKWRVVEARVSRGVLRVYGNRDIKICGMFH